MPWSFVATGALAGLASTLHCAGMCGPLSAMACQRGGLPVRGWYQLGRTITYTGLGLAVGLAGGWIRSVMTAGYFSVFISLSLGAGLLAMAWQLVRRSRQPDLLVPLTLGPRPPKRTGGHGRALLIGLAGGFLPCGALGAALLVAAGSGSPETAAVTMAAFATTTGLGLLGAGSLVSWIQRRSGRVGLRVLATVLVFFAVGTSLRPLLIRSDQACCDATKTEAPLGR